MDNRSKARPSITISEAKWLPGPGGIWIGETGGSIKIISCTFRKLRWWERLLRRQSGITLKGNYPK